MVVFLILPAIAWEDLSTSKAFAKGFKILGEEKKEFLVAYGITGIFTISVMLIPTIIYTINDKLSLNLPESFWIGVLVYMAFAASLSFLVEQLYVAELYFDYMKGEKKTLSGSFT